MILAAAALVVLTCTAPTAGQRWTRIFDPEINDSTWSVECSGGEAIHDSLWVTLWGQSLSGGGYAAGDSAYVAPGDSVFFTVGPGHYYAVARNGIGPSCATAVPVYVPPSDPTGVPESPKGDSIVSSHLFDVRGRLVRGPPSSGIYWRRDTYRSGRVVVHKVALLH